MGRYLSYTKTTADSLRRLDSQELNGYGYYTHSQKRLLLWKNQYNEVTSSINIESIVNSLEGIRLILAYTVNPDDDDSYKRRYSLSIISTPCNYGGARYWFECPLTVNGVCCGRRVAKLYFLHGWFGCRHCHRLSYNSRNEAGRNNPLLRFFKLDMEVDRLRKNAKRRTYAGRLTKNMRRAYELSAKSWSYGKIAIDSNLL